MSERGVLYSCLALVVLTLLCILLVDRPVADAMTGVSRDVRAGVQRAVGVLEIVFGFPISKFLSGAVVVLAGLLLAPFRRGVAWAFVFVGLAQLTTRLLVGVLKNVFARLRPFETTVDQWFVDGGSAFPSGHAAHFWGFWFALAMLLPRWRWPLLILPVLTSIARVVVNDHYTGDVVGSAAIAAGVTFAWAKLFMPRVRRNL